MASIWQKMREDAERDVEKFQGDLDRVNELLADNPTAPDLLKRKKLISWFLDKLSEGIEMMVELEKADNA